jgi:hypothetical protein
MKSFNFSGQVHKADLVGIPASRRDGAQRVRLSPVPVLLIFFLGIFLARQAPAQRIYQEGNLVYLENDQQTRIGIRLDWGGVIVEVSQAGENFVDHNDVGRDIQLALFDGNSFYSTDVLSAAEGYNPTQGGDYWGHGSPLLATSFAGGVLYTKTQPYEWDPDNKGGGADKPVPADVTMEQWIRFLPGFANVYAVHYRVMHLGQDVHAAVAQLLPVVYVLLKYNRCVTYSGAHPWQNDAETVVTLPTVTDLTDQAVFPATENWFAFVTDSNVGLTTYCPNAYPFLSGLQLPPGAQNPSYTVEQMLFTSLLPGASYEGDYYLIPGDYRTARQTIYQIRNIQNAVDVTSPFGSLGAVRCAAIPSSRLISLSGFPVFDGWAFDNVGVKSVNYYVDGIFTGKASYGAARPDVADFWQGLPGAPNFGFSFTVDTSKYSTGFHGLEVSVADQAGNVGVLPKVWFQKPDVVAVHRLSATSAADYGGRLPIVVSNTISQHEPPYGSLDLIDGTGMAFGWAVDGDASTASVTVKFFIDGTEESGVPAGSAVANLARSDLEAACGIDGNHGFQFSVPLAFRDGHSHSVYAYAVGARNSEVLLSGSPQTYAGH